MDHTLAAKNTTLKQPPSKFQSQKKKTRTKSTVKQKKVSHLRKHGGSTTITTTIPSSYTSNVATTSQSSFAAPSTSSSFFPSKTLLPLPTASANVDFIETNSEQEENENRQEEDDADQLENQQEKISSMAAAVVADSSTYSTSNTLPANDNRLARIAGPIIGIFAGVAFLAVAMFIVVRNRNKRLSTLNKNRKDEEDENNNENKFHDIPLNDDDEGIAVMKKMPSLIAQQQYKDERVSENKKLSFISTTSTAYHSMSSTLVASRSNSVSTKQVNQQHHESWQSAKSYNDESSDMVISPDSTTFSERIQSFLMTAERQKLHHERPNLLNHFEYRPHSKPPIETYKAQLANILEPEEDSLLLVIDNEFPLPFNSLMDIKEFY